MALFSTKIDDEVVTRLTGSQTELLAYIQSLLPGNPSVKDVLQQVNLVIWKKRAAFKSGTNFRAWAFSIARWEVRTFLKECKKGSWLILDDTLTDKISDTLGEKIQDGTMDQMHTYLNQCLKKLKPTERELIDQRYFEKITLKDYATKQGRSLDSLKTSLYRIRTALRRCIEAQRATEKATSQS